MSRLDELIQELCPDGVEYKSIGSFANCYPGATPKTTHPEYWENGTISWMSSGEVNQGEVYYTEKKITQLGFDNTSTKMVPVNSVVIALAGQGKTRGTVAITRIPLCTNQSLCAIVTNETVDSKYLFHFLKSQYQQLRDISSGDGTRGGLNLKMINSYLVPVPPIIIQHEIVRILDNFTELTAKITAELSAELTARKKQYEYYRDFLLTFPKYDEKTLTDRQTDRNNDGIRWLRLKDIADLFRGEYITKKGMHEGTIPVILGGQEPAYYIEKSNHIGEIVVVARSGASAGFVSYWNEPIFITDGFGYEAKNEVMTPKYLYYVLKNMESELNGMKRGAGVPHVSGEMLGKVLLPVPPIDEQKWIVSLLDRFDNLCNDITTSLPAEIAARQKQYEYYRDKLLTFKPLTA